MEIRRLRASELEQAWQLDQDAFHSPDAQREGFLRWDPERLVGAFEGGRLVAMSGAIGFGQFFGGRRVPMGGLSAVAVTPDRRGAGVARRVVAACLPDMRQRGEVISSLYPATTSLYRSLGWEVAGAVAWRTVVPARLAGIPRPEGVSMRPADAGDHAAVHACYARLARETSGLLDRHEGWWGLRESRAQGASTWLAVNEAGDVEGYLVYRRRDGSLGPGGPFRLAVDDFVWTTRDAGRALWRLIASWSTQVERVSYMAGVEDPSALILPEQVSETLAELRWMTRVVDAPGAVAARGFPTGLEVEVPLELRDDLLPDNAGPWRLRVAGGRGCLERGGPGGPVLDAGAFSALYTGFAGSALLARTGRLAGGSAEQRAALDAAFAGPTPALLDQF
jgi:predicted acetyltransferase